MCWGAREVVQIREQAQKVWADCSSKERGWRGWWNVVEIMDGTCERGCSRLFDVYHQYSEFWEYGRRTRPYGFTCTYISATVSVYVGGFTAGCAADAIVR